MTSISSADRARFSSVSERFGRGWSAPTVPDAAIALRAAQATAGNSGGRNLGWTGLNLVRSGSAQSVKDHLGESRDAANTMVVANVDMYSVRFAYGTHKGMENYLVKPPKDGKLKLQVACMPSWHAGEWSGKSFGGDVARQLQGADGSFKLDKADVVKVLGGNSSMKRLAEEEISKTDGVERVADYMVQLFEGNGGNSMSKADATELLQDIGKQLSGLLHGEKFSKENTYNVQVKVDGKVIKQLKFDVTGKEGGSGRATDSHHSTLSPEFELDYDALKGKNVVIDAWPDGSAGVGGYEEARRTTLNL